MPAKLEYYENGVIVRHAGVVTDKEFVNAKREIYDHEYDRPLEFQLAELSGVTDCQVSMDTMRAVGSWDHANSQELQGQHLVVAAPPESLMQTLSIVWEIWSTDHHSGNPSTKIVDSLHEALGWLKTQGIAVVPKDSAGPSPEPDQTMVITARDQQPYVPKGLECNGFS